RDLEERLGSRLSLRQEDHGKVEREKKLEGGTTTIVIEGIEECHLGFAEDLNSIFRKSFDETGEHESRTGNVRLAEGAAEAPAVGQKLERERFPLAAEEQLDGKGLFQHRADPFIDRYR